MERLHFYIEYSAYSKQVKMKYYLRFPTGSKSVIHSLHRTTENE